ncbi:MAG: WG repeat-containing protein [Acidobacteriota bacterium]|nr:MAG: WG repeat-containing protein [Acidobacteriota bacterium]
MNTLKGIGIDSTIVGLGPRNVLQIVLCVLCIAFLTISCVEKKTGNALPEAHAEGAVDEKEEPCEGHDHADKDTNSTDTPRIELRGKYSEGLAPALIAHHPDSGIEIGMGYVNLDGEVVIDGRFYQPGDFSEGLARVVSMENEKVGFIDKKGNWVVEPQFIPHALESCGPDPELEYFSEGRALVYTEEACGFIDKTGKFVIGPKFTQAGKFSDGLAPFINLVKDEEDESGRRVMDWEAGYIDREGNVVIEPKFEWALSFSEGLAAVEINDKWGFIDKTGEFVIPPKFPVVYGEYTNPGPFKDGKATITTENGYGTIDRTGKFVDEAAE